MNTIKYSKLVRDRIPEIIEASGNTCITEILSDSDYLRMIDAKLDEELAEYHKDQNIEELADLLEVIRAAAIARGRAWERIALMRCCEDTKEAFVTESMTMRQHSIFLQLYLDIADWCEKNPAEPLDLLNMRHVLSDRSWWLR